MIAKFALWFIAGACGMEFLSYAVHRWLFHGPLWAVHRTHHYARRGAFELNDIFAAVFAALSMALMIFAPAPVWKSWQFPVGLGVAVYGLAYFIAHDLLTHRRWLVWHTDNVWLNQVRRAHQKHHQSVARVGQKPFGLFSRF